MLVKLSAAVAVIIVILGVISLPIGLRAVRGINYARVKISEAEYALVTQKNFSLARENLEAAESIFNAASKDLRMLSFLRVIPWVSIHIKSARAASLAAQHGLRALIIALKVAGEVYEPFRGARELTIGEIPKGKRESALQIIQTSLPKLQEAKRELEQAKNLLEKIPRDGLTHALQEDITKLKDQVNLAVALSYDGIPLLEVAPRLFGFPEIKNYLFVLQNSDEMRPSGGFIGTSGLLTFDAGHITQFYTDDVYNIDRFAPSYSRPSSPDPIRYYLEQPKFYLRDANWSPDFSESAKTIMQFFSEELPFAARKNPALAYAAKSATPIHGVIAVMPEAIRSLLKLTGPITVRNQTFTPENLTDVLEYEVEIGFAQKGIPRPQRKEIISELGHALITKVMDLPIKLWPDALAAIRDALDEKQILIYSTDQDLQSLLTMNSWSGTLAQSSVDYLGVFDANLFSLKTDPYVTRSIFYHAFGSEHGLMGEVEIVYSYPKEGPAWKTKGYRSWTRVYVPKGSILQSALGPMRDEESRQRGGVVITQEFDKTVFGAFLAVQAGEVKRLKFIYRLPEYIEEAVALGAYELTVQKQPGTLGHSLTVITDFGKVPKLWSPTGLNASRQENRLTWQTNLRQDQAFYVEF